MIWLAFFPLIMVISATIAVFVSVSVMVRHERPRPPRLDHRLDAALEDLAERFSRGEVTHDDLEPEAERLTREHWDR